MSWRGGSRRRGGRPPRAAAAALTLKRSAQQATCALRQRRLSRSHSTAAGSCAPGSAAAAAAMHRGAPQRAALPVELEAVGGGRGAAAAGSRPAMWCCYAVPNRRSCARRADPNASSWGCRLGCLTGGGLSTFSERGAMASFASRSGCGGAPRDRGMLDDARCPRTRARPCPSLPACRAGWGRPGRLGQAGASAAHSRHTRVQPCKCARSPPSSPRLLC